jgi:hypothetical protein
MLDFLNLGRCLGRVFEERLQPEARPLVSQEGELLVGRHKLDRGWRAPIKAVDN